jgi:hypothetical protein
MGTARRLSGVLIPGDPIPSDGPIVFLAGPVSGCEPWRPEARRLLHRSCSGVPIADPTPIPGAPRIADEVRVRWEFDAMVAAARRGCLVFWIPPQDRPMSMKLGYPKPYAAATRFELGLWLGRRALDPGARLVVGIDPTLAGGEYWTEQIGAAGDVKVLDSLDAVRLAACAALRGPEVQKVQRVAPPGSSPSTA